ncbi:MAG: ATP-dependent metallopeptidase FtsH/Yme1/Tma family protein, partial [Pseudomonadota bacterium]
MGNARNIAFWLVLFLLILALFNLFNGSNTNLQSQSIPYSEFVEAVEQGEVARVVLDGENVRFQRDNGSNFSTIKPQDAEITKLLIENSVPVSAEAQEQSGFQSFLMT